MMCFGPEDWKQFYNIDVQGIPDNPWDEAINTPCPFHEGKTVADTHFLFLGIECINDTPLTIMEWHRHHSYDGQPRFFWDGDDIWYRNESFATKTTCAASWYLMLKEFIPGTDNNLRYEEQLQFLPDNYTIPTAVEMVTANMLAVQKSGQAINELKWAWSSDIESLRSEGVAVGHYHRNKDIGDGKPALRIHDFWHNDERSSVGLATMRKVL